MQDYIVAWRLDFSQIPRRGQNIIGVAMLLGRATRHREILYNHTPLLQEPLDDLDETWRHGLEPARSYKKIIREIHDRILSFADNARRSQLIPPGVYSSRNASIGCSRDALHAGP
jgi:hypothetical protein